jgi:hypothetical protein
MAYFRLETPDDIAWLRDVHIPHLPSRVKFAEGTGNEDAPELIECWYSANPRFDEKPDLVWTPATTSCVST